jgi:hypothetical protein
MGELFTPLHLIVLVFAFGFMVLAIVPYWKIFEKAGFPPAISLLMYVPLANLIVLYYVAFSEWKPTRG